MSIGENNVSTAWGTTILRVVVGLIFLAHGVLKLKAFGIAGTAGLFASIGIPLASVAAPLVIALETLGGVALILGLFTRWFAIPLAFTMVVAILTAHLKAGFFLPNGYEFALIVLAGSVTLALQGSGALALDNVLGAARTEASDLSVVRA